MKKQYRVKARDYKEVNGLSTVRQARKVLRGTCRSNPNSPYFGLLRAQHIAALKDPQAFVEQGSKIEPATEYTKLGGVIAEVTPHGK